MKIKEFIRRLKSVGVIITKGRGKGVHILARYGETWTTVPVHGDTDVDPQFLKRICKQLGIDPREVL